MTDKLRDWQELHGRARTKYDDVLKQMSAREKLYAGSEKISQIACKDEKKATPHVRNIVAEIIEAQVNSTIPQPKVTARRKEDEPLAKIIEDMIRNELDRLPFEPMNDRLARTVPIQGGAGFLVEWDESQRTHTTTGEIVVSDLHPRMIIPQDGVFSGIEDMDYVFVEVPQTKEYIRKRYGKDVFRESEDYPEDKGDDRPSDELVTQVFAYYRNDGGGIGLYSWAGDVELCDLNNYQARRIRKCVECGTPEPIRDYPRNLDDPDQAENEHLFGGDKQPHVCPNCGGTEFEEQDNEYEELEAPLTLFDGTVIPPNDTWEEPTGEFDQMGQPIVNHRVKPRKIPYYQPRVFPVVLIRNTSKDGQFLGGSDVDLIAYQQNTINRLSAKICDKILKSGSVITLPPDARIKENGEDCKTIRITQPKDKDMIGVYNLEVNIQQDMDFREQAYQEARQIIGVTDSFQGRADPTATSGKAKEFAAAQSAGRLESKRVMRDWAYSELFKLMFMWKLAYADEPRPVVSHDASGDVTYGEFNRYDFLRQDADGNFYWLDDFIFSTDVTAPLANNREAMWQETRLNFQQGAFGNPQDLNTLILFWSKMAQLHYPGAEDTKTEFQRMFQEQQMQQQMMMQQQQQIEELARQNAMRDVGVQQEEPKPVIPINMQNGMDNMLRVNEARGY